MGSRTLGHEDLEQRKRELEIALEEDTDAQIETNLSFGYISNVRSPGMEWVIARQRSWRIRNGKRRFLKRLRKPAKS